MSRAAFLAFHCQSFSVDGEKSGWGPEVRNGSCSKAVKLKFMSSPDRDLSWKDIVYFSLQHVMVHPRAHRPFTHSRASLFQSLSR